MAFSQTSDGRILKILAGGAVGAFIGSSIGIAALGTAIAGTVPMALLGGYLVYQYTKPKPVIEVVQSPELKSNSEGV